MIVERASNASYKKAVLRQLRMDIYIYIYTSYAVLSSFLGGGPSMDEMEGPEKNQSSIFLFLAHICHISSMRLVCCGGQSCGWLGMVGSTWVQPSLS